MKERGRRLIKRESGKHTEWPARQQTDSSQNHGVLSTLIVSESSRDPQALWRCVKGLLFMNKSSATFVPGICDRFSAFFNDKILNVKAKVSVLKSQLTINSKQPPVRSTITTPLELFIETSEAEVSKLIARLPNKSSPLDYIHTSLLKSRSDRGVHTMLTMRQNAS